MIRSFLRFQALAVVGLVALGGCDQVERLIDPGKEGDLLPKEQIGIHMSPTEVNAADIAEAAGLASLIRMQIPLDVEAQTEALVDGAPANARFLMILTADPTPAYGFMDRHRFDPKVVAYQLENEPENPDFQGWTPEQYIDWLDEVIDEVERRRGPGQVLVSAATRPMVQNFPGNRNWNRSAIDLGMLDYVDVYAMHVYTEQFEKLFNIEEQVISLVESAGLPIWVTETGTTNFDDQLSYFRRVTDAYPDFSINPERWVIYAWRDDTLGFSLRNPQGQNSPLLQALIDRENG